ncbi:RNA-binding S4 domain-containing protein [Rhizobium sp. CG5]|uniref:RNA-binding S4 domain-containing protein n=1 Tax=Rhizobium sp. CG5 TaxID=2726076 RepID=UPI0020343643|nr:RNA-binding S4 domain-containing protein [Rhizobium sp. CG5]MCM2477136.1 RNA-binding S4 domain-containing protein [Rhizobium sp. CG5]
MGENQSSPGSQQRIDKWLFFARLAKSRTLAQGQVVSGLVSVNGRKIKQPSLALRPGDRLEITRPVHNLVVVVRQIGERRGPYEEARLLYEDVSPPVVPGSRPSSLDQAVRMPGAGRPTKRERRAIDRLRWDEPWTEE